LVNTHHALRDEEQLKQDLAKDSAHAFEEIFRLYHSQICNYVYKLLHDSDDAREVAQQIFVNLWEKRSEAVNINSLRSYLFRTAHNTCLNKFKHDKVKDRFLSEEGYLLEKAFIDDFENTYDPEYFAQVKLAVEDLPKKNKEVFKLRYYKNLKTKEVAKELNITPRTVETHVSNALKILREKLQHLLVILILFFF